MQQFVKVFLANHAYRRIVLGLNGSRAFRPSEEGDLSEVLSRIQRPYKSFLSMLILDEALTVALGNDEEVVGGLSLLNFDLLRLAHYQLNLRDHVVFDFRVESEDQVLLQLFRKDETRHLLLERGTDHPEELS